MSIKVKVDVCNREKIAGWAINEISPLERVALDLLVDGKFHNTIFARRERPDLKKAGIGDGKHGFLYNFSNRVKSKSSLIICLVLSDTNQRVYMTEI